MIRRQLLFAPGDTVDTLLVSETMRRLRRQRLFSDVVLQARRCDPSGAVALVLHARDSWSLHPTARLRTPSSLSIGLEERNLFGTGRSMSVTHEMSARGTGAAVAFSDPWLFGSDVGGHLRIAKLGGAHTLRAGLRTYEYSVFDRWRAEASVARLSYADTSSSDHSLHTINAMALTGWRIGSSPTTVTMLVAGVEFDSAASILKSRRAGAPAGTTHVRSFLGADFGVMRRTAVWDTASWIVPGQGFLDVPLGWEADGVVAGGYQRGINRPAAKLDAWMGRIWLPSRGRILMLDAWASGYLRSEIDANQIARLSLGWYQEASGGMWGARLTAERMIEVDPDLRGLSPMLQLDYTAPAVRPYALRGGRTVAGALERSFYLFRVGGASVIDAGPFVAASHRAQVEGLRGGSIGTGVVGARVRLLSANGAVRTVRLDLGYPVLRSELLPQRGFAVLTIGTLFDVSRQRDGRRLY
jgi:hypothetical protein